MEDYGGHHTAEALYSWLSQNVVPIGSKHCAHIAAQLEDNVVVLHPNIFDETVVRSEHPWLVDFSAGQVRCVE